VLVGDQIGPVPAKGWQSRQHHVDERTETPNVHGLVVEKVIVDLGSLEGVPTIQVTKVTSQGLVFLHRLRIGQAPNEELFLQEPKWIFAWHAQKEVREQPFISFQPKRE
jgi:hypothetical protein